MGFTRSWLRFCRFHKQFSVRESQIKSTKLKPCEVYSVSFASMRTLLGKLSSLLCALIATGAAAQVSAPGAAGRRALEEDQDQTARAQGTSSSNCVREDRLLRS